MPSKQLKAPLFWATCALLLIALSRFLLMPALTFDQDEVWSAWLTFGSLPEAISRTDTNWSAWFNVLVYTWSHMMGYAPFAIRLLPFYLFMLSAAFTYQLGLTLFKRHDAALLSLVAYAGLGYMVYLSVYLRPYALAIPLLPLGLTFVIRYFEQPTLKRAIILGLHLAVMFYVSIMAIFPFMAFGLISLALYPRKIWRWGIVGLIAAIAALPELLSKLQIILARTSTSIETRLPPLPIAVYEMFGEYAGPAFILWIILAGIALLLILRSRQQLWLMLSLLAWAVLGTCLLYWLNSRTSLFRPRYAWWIAWAIPLFLAYGLAQLPLWGKRFAIGLLLAFSFIFTFSPEGIAAYKEPIENIESLFEWFDTHYEAGDAVIIDPNTANFRHEVWDYYSFAFMENGLNVVDSPSSSYSRIWYLHSNETVDESLEQSIQEGRLRGIFYGSPGLQIQLYEAPPNPAGILFANGLRFHGTQVLDGEGLARQPLVMPEGSYLRLRLWWSVDEPLSQEYSVGLKLMSGRWEGVYAQQDGAPHAIYLLPIFNQTLEPIGDMTTWQTGQYYVEERIIELPYVERPQRTRFTVYMTVYQWQDGVRISAEGTNDEDLLPLLDFVLMAW